VQGGAILSEWKPKAASIIASGTRGRVGEIVDLINQGTDFVEYSKTAWTPPINYTWYAEKLGLGPAYVKRCEEWFSDKQNAHVAPVKAQVIDPEPMLALFKKYSKKGPPSESGVSQPTVPPLHKRVVAWECAGYTKEQIELYIARDQWMENQKEIKQQRLDAIFGEYPSASKPTPKKKVIKAVKKKMRY